MQDTVKESELKLMLRHGDRNNKFDGEEVDYEDFMFIMQQANLF